MEEGRASKPKKPGQLMLDQVFQTEVTQVSGSFSCFVRRPESSF